jgi:hypothetical protein
MRNVDNVWLEWENDKSRHILAPYSEHVIVGSVGANQCRVRKWNDTIPNGMYWGKNRHRESLANFPFHFPLSLSETRLGLPVPIRKIARCRTGAGTTGLWLRPSATIRSRQNSARHPHRELSGSAVINIISQARSHRQCWCHSVIPFRFTQSSATSRPILWLASWSAVHPLVLRPISPHISKTE